MKEKQEILDTEVCECGEKSVAQAIEIFQNCSLPFKKAKKLVTECNKSCCRLALLRLYEMNQFGSFDLEEIDSIIQKRLERIKRLAEEA